MSETELVTMDLGEYCCVWMVLGFFLGLGVGCLSTFATMDRKYNR